MIKKLNDLLSGWPMTAVGGVFLLASFILPRIGFPAGGYLAWICVAICGIPLLYLVIHRIIFNKGVSKISSALLISLAMIAAILIGERVGLLLAGKMKPDLLRKMVYLMVFISGVITILNNI